MSGDTIIFPVGVGQNPVLIALRLGASSDEALPINILPQGGSEKEFEQ